MKTNRYFGSNFITYKILIVIFTVVIVTLYITVDLLKCILAVNNLVRLLFACYSFVRIYTPIVLHSF
jgi:hypothetical protein